MLNPNVGLVVDISMPQSFFTIVVLPALSKPLEGLYQPERTWGVLSLDLGGQEEDTHFFLFFPLFADDGKEAHGEFVAG
jgi:hypothetical protein